MSPSLVVAIVALVLAVDGTAEAAEQIVTRPDKVATGVIEARHIAQTCASGNAGLDRQVLRVRVAHEGRRPATAGNSTPA